MRTGIAPRVRKLPFASRPRSRMIGRDADAGNVSLPERKLDNCSSKIIAVIKIVQKVASTFGNVRLTTAAENYGSKQPRRRKTRP